MAFPWALGERHGQARTDTDGHGRLRWQRCTVPGEPNQPRQGRSSLARAFTPGNPGLPTPNKPRQGRQESLGACLGEGEVLEFHSSSRVPESDLHGDQQQE